LREKAERPIAIDSGILSFINDKYTSTDGNTRSEVGIVINDKRLNQYNLGEIPNLKITLQSPGGSNRLRSDTN